MMGVAGGGGAAAGGTGTDVALAVMVGTGVAAMTGVWETVGGTLWKGVAGQTEDTAATCCEPSGQKTGGGTVGPAPPPETLAITLTAAVSEAGVSEPGWGVRSGRSQSGRAEPGA